VLSSKSLGKILFSVVCLIVIIAIVLVMLNEQKKMIISSNQNVEVAELLYTMKKSLIGNGCSENFSGLEKADVKNKTLFLKFLTNFPNGDVGILRKFHKGQEHPNLSETGLTIKEYRMTLSDGVEYLEIVFDRNYDGETFVKQIPLYFTLYSNGRIKACSLTPLIDEKEIWESQNGSLYLTKYLNLIINDGHGEQKLNLSGSLYIEGVLSTCSSHNDGAFGWNDTKQGFYLCHGNQLISLTEDERGAVN
jgi:hypothetical protein